MKYTLPLNLFATFFILLLFNSQSTLANASENSVPISGTTTVSAYPNNANDIGIFLDPIWDNRYFGGTGAPNGVFAYSNLSPGQTSQIFLPFDYRMNIPCNAIITSVSVEVTRRNSLSGDLTDSEVRLRFSDYTYSNSSLATTNIWLESTTAWETVTYTDPTWGNVITPEMLNSEMFGIALSATNIDGVESAQAEIDAINLIVCYDLVGASYTPIELIVNKQNDICNQGLGGMTFAPTGGSGSYEYSIDGGLTWTSNPIVTGLSSGDYTVIVRNDDGSCQTKEAFCSIGYDDGIIQPGDAVIACKPTASSSATLVIESIQPFSNLLNSGYAGQDVSCFIEPIQTSYSTADLCGSVFSLSLDEDSNIYTGTTTLYEYTGSQATPVVSVINAMTGAVTKLATLPGNYGIAGVEYQAGCNQLFVANLEDGIIYRLDATTGNTLSTFDPLGSDNGSDGFAPLGERIVAVTYNSLEGKLYYSVWNNDAIDNGIRNTIRSVDIDPNTCDFIPSTDMLQLDLPWLSEVCGSATSLYSMPVSDIEFSTDGSTMLLSEVGFNTGVPASSPHQSRLLEYDGSTTNWTLDNGGNSNNCKYNIGYGFGLNSRGGNDFAYAGTNGTSCTQGDETYIVSTGDALSGISCYAEGCYYGLQYLDASAGGNQFTSILLDMDRDAASQAKSVYGDVDIVLGCSENDVLCSLTYTNPSCYGISDGSIVVSGSGGSGNYEFSIDGGLTYQASNIFSNLLAGNYIITVRDLNMSTCSSSCSASLDDPGPAPCHNISLNRD